MISKYSRFIMVFLIGIFQSSKAYALTFNDIKYKINEAFYQYEMVAKGYMKLGDVEIIYLIVPLILLIIVAAIIIALVEGATEFIGVVIGGALAGVFFGAKFLTDFFIERFSNFEEDHEFKEKTLRFFLFIMFFCLIPFSLYLLIYELFLFFF